MKTRLCSLCSGLAFGFFLMLGTGMIFSSCQDDLLEDSYPKWLGSSVYGELENRKDFTYTLKLIDDLEYAEVLKKTGSKTVFVADDAAWNRFFNGGDNPWGVSSYADLSHAQKRWIFDNSMINAAYLAERLSSGTKAEASDDPNRGVVMRRYNTTYTFDTIAVYAGSKRDELPNGDYWTQIKAQDSVFFSIPSSDPAPMVHFVTDFRTNRQITDDDMSFMFGNDFDPQYEIYLWNVPVVTQDVTCQNGYIHVLRDLLVPPSNMSGELANNQELRKVTKTFNRLMDRYTMPTDNYMSNHKENGHQVLRKGYFAQNGAYALKNDSSDTPQPQLLYDPAWQCGAYATGEGWGQNMSTIFVPTDQALEDWWNSSTGRLVMHGFNAWEDVPKDLLARLINNHMKTSFLGSLPSIFNKVLNDGNREQGIVKDDIAKDEQGNRLIFPANNGMIYVVNKVYTPDSYISVMAPCLNIENLRVMGWAVTNTDKTTYIPDGYGTYLNSMESTFSFVVPTDDALLDYWDPFTVAADGSYQRISFRYNESSKTVVATVAKVETNGNVGTSSTVNATKVKTLLKDILNNCIVIMDKKDWSKGGYYQTKGGAYLNISAFTNGGTVLSGGNEEKAETPEVVTFYNQSDKILNGEPGSGGNGVTMAVNKAIQPTKKPVIDILNSISNPELSEFAALVAGSDVLIDEEYSNRQDTLKLYQALVLPKKAGTQTVISNTECISFLSNYNYTLYAPNNDAMAKAYSEGLPSWEDLAQMEQPEEIPSDATAEVKARLQAKRDSILNVRKVYAKKILNFIRYHFQDNSIFTDGTEGYYKTQSFNYAESVFYELYANPTAAGGFEIASRNGTSKAKVLPNVLKNAMAREYQFDGVPSSATGINSSAYVVVHAIDAPLFFSEKGDDGIRAQFK